MDAIRSWIRAGSDYLALARKHIAQAIKSALGSPGSLGSILIALLSAGTIWLGAFYMAVQDGNRTEEAAYQDTANLARAFEENTIRLIQAYDQIILFARTSYTADPLGFNLVEWAHDQKFSTDAALQIVIINKSGFLAASTLGMPRTPMDLSDREHFRVHIHDDRDNLFISKPVLGRLSHKWSLQMSRRIFNPDGSFGGVILVSIDPYYLVHFYDSIDVDKKGMVLLAGLDGVVRARISSYNRTIGQSIASGELFKHLVQAPSGSFVTGGRIDGVVRLASYRTVRGYPLVVAVGLARAQVFAGVHRHRILYFGASAFITLIIFVFTAMIVRRQIGLHRAKDQLWEAAHYDHLTKLPNRSRLYEEVDAILCTGDDACKQFTLLLLDLDDFKVVNDTLGHEAGDLVLRTAAERVKAIVQPSVIVARLGGDEFAVLIRRVLCQQEIDEITQCILRALRTKVDYRGRCIEISVSIGIAIFPVHATNWSNLFRAADLALYRAKKAGRGRAAVFEPQMLVEAESRFEILGLVRAAIDDDRIVPFYQPQVEIKSGAVIGFEALARIKDNGPRLISPKEFLSALDDPEAGRLFGQKMMETVFRDLRAWHEAGLDVGRIALNATALELAANDYADRVIATLRSYGLGPDNLEIEITESVTLDEKIPAICINLTTLAAAGVSISLDDFGTGYASLTHIKSLPIKRVKIDRSFIVSVASDPESESVVDAVIRLSHNLGKSVVAEGVDDEAQVHCLKDLGCDVAQGYLVSKPMPFDMVTSYLLHHIASIGLSRKVSRRSRAKQSSFDSSRDWA
jgi:diguanylate cyclase (GGDEF)-like protein